MPLYEYEKKDDDCLMCPGRFAVLQALAEPPLADCPWCGLPVRRVVSQVNINANPRESDPEKAAKQGFTTWKKTAHGTWEKLAGPGVDAIVASEADKQAVAEETKPKPTLDLDNP